jgi:hypothetical protein
MTDLSPDFFDRRLAEVDPEIAEVLQRELERQQTAQELLTAGQGVDVLTAGTDGTARVAARYPLYQHLRASAPV